MESNAKQVRKFATAAFGAECPETPRPLDSRAVEFIVRMILSELTELVELTEKDSTGFIMDCLGSADIHATPTKPASADELAAEQADALVDIWYYSLDIAARHGINLSRIFDIVHKANMDKKWPDGTFHHREDGKIIKPPTWNPPDVVAEIIQQKKDGAWKD